jgi:hypothetical protein
MSINEYAFYHLYQDKERQFTLELERLRVQKERVAESSPVRADRSVTGWIVPGWLRATWSGATGRRTRSFR